MEIELNNVHEWYAKKINKTVDELSEHDFFCAKVAYDYACDQCAINVVVKSLPTKEAISSVARKKALKYAYANEYVYEQYVKAIEEGANYIKNHIEKQK